MKNDMARVISRNLLEALEGNRSFEIRAEDISADKNSLTLAFSSETKDVKSWYPEIGTVWEILDHSPESVDLSRLQNRAPFLCEHDRQKQIGCIESATVDSDKTGRAKVTCGQSSMAKDLWPDIVNRIRPHISVGYRVLALSYDEDTGKIVTEGERDGIPIVRVSRWQPLEISSVSLPADWSVGVGRSESINKNQEKNMRRNILFAPDPAAGGGSAAPASVPATQPSVAIVAEPNDYAPVARSIMENAQHFGLVNDGIEAIGKRMSLADFNNMLLKKVPASPQSPALPQTQGRQHRTPAEAFVASKQYQDAMEMLKRGRCQFAVSCDTDFQADFARFIDPREMHQRVNTVSEEIISGFTGRPVQLPSVLLGVQRPRIADLLMPGTTDSLVVPYYYETTAGSDNNKAAAVLNSSYADGGTMAKSDVTLTETTAAVKDIGTYIKVGEIVLQDVSQVQSQINVRLPYYVNIEEDRQLLKGSGSSGEITGLMNTSGIGTISAGSYEGGPVDAILAAATKVYTSSFFPAEWVIAHPNDAARLKMTKDKNGQYLFGGPAFLPYGNGAFPGGYQIDFSVWGLPGIATTQMAEGTMLVGNRVGAQLFRRQGLTIQMTNTDQDDFIKRLVTFRAYLRSALAVYRPSCYCTITGVK